ncbi:LysR family transcriptional regulator [Bordetella genomosp. 8]|uniref:LysR family transcriptional regulator n=1 Tax=Bordetella genomosp. 8 TaxID=1416806 RepID=UPI001E4A07E4|nr:LysR family transcriptional regulator [Bordetella genomosp. 8]
MPDLAAFATVAELRSFTRAAARLGISTSMLSYTIKRLEKGLGIPLLHRTSRSVSTTEAGERLLRTLAPALASIEETLDGLAQQHDHVTGTVRITATRQAYEAVIRPVLGSFADRHPDARVEVSIEYGFRDIVADRFDAGIRLGEKLADDMVAFKAGPELRMAVVASPTYFERRSPPREPRDLAGHRCINYRMVAADAVYAWEFEQNGRPIRAAVTGPLLTNEPDVMLQAALDGLGIAYVLEHEADVHLRAGTLVRMLEDWTPSFPGFYFYYPSRRRVSAALASLVRILRERHVET